MRVFELLTALCVYSQDGYELVLKALQDFQVNIYLLKIFYSFERNEKKIFQKIQLLKKVYLISVVSLDLLC
jgi:hypothetical protein